MPVNSTRLSGNKVACWRCSPSINRFIVPEGLTFKVTGDRSPKGGENRQAQLAGHPVDRRVGRLAAGSRQAASNDVH